MINKVALVSFLSKPGLEGKTDVYFTNNSKSSYKRRRRERIRSLTLPVGASTKSRAKYNTYLHMNLDNRSFGVPLWRILISLPC